MDDLVLEQVDIEAQELQTVEEATEGVVADE
jgi:hypothetical protein